MRRILVYALVSIVSPKFSLTVICSIAIYVSRAIVVIPSTNCKAMSWGQHPHARSSHQRMPLSGALVTIRFQISADYPNRYLIMGIPAGTNIHSVKMLLAMRAQASGHRNLVPANPAMIRLYMHGQLLWDNYRIRPEHPLSMSLF